MNKFHEIKIVSTDETYLYLQIDGAAYRLRWIDASPVLANATMAERSAIEISPSGYGLHWRLVDEDLAINPLLEMMERIEPAPSILRDKVGREMSRG
ncbi:MAG: DUF2442 domain-containing protein [Chloroflexi bacterium]|nr:DUF2442 domain-containing protein [Chloroflexota bacterium]